MLDKIKSGKKLIVVLLKEDDSISTRLADLVSQYESLYGSAGFEVYFVDVTYESQQEEETACVRVPQIRVFVKGKMVKKAIGIITSNELENLVRDI